MADRSGSSAQELVYCHECHNEWNKDEHGLVCPECHSDFTEIVEQNHDPRAPEPDENLLAGWPSPELFYSSNNGPLQDLNPWADNPPDPAEGDINEVIHESRPDGSVHFTRISYRSSGTPRARGPAQDPAQANPVIQDFQRMLQGILGPHVGGLPSQNLESDRRPGAGRHDHGMFSGQHGDGHPLNGRLDGIDRGEAPQHGLGASGGRRGSPWLDNAGLPRGGDGSSFPRDLRNDPPGQGQVGDLPGVLQLLFESFGDPVRNNAGAGANRPPASPFQAIFSSILNPGAAALGDAVYTQEALDRVITQLMEANTASSAPGPATQDAIAALSKKQLDMSMLDDEGKAECSVCMDDVPVGTEVTVLPCTHWFHGQCVTAWLSEHDTCPICRKGTTPKAEPSQTPSSERTSESSRSAGGSRSWTSRRYSAAHLPGSFPRSERLSGVSAGFPQDSSGAVHGPPSSSGPSGSSGTTGVWENFRAARPARPSEPDELPRLRVRAEGPGTTRSDNNSNSDNSGGISGRLRNWFGGSSG